MLFSAPPEDVPEAHPLAGDGGVGLLGGLVALPLDGGSDRRRDILDLLVVLACPLRILGLNLGH